MPRRIALVVLVLGCNASDPPSAAVEPRTFEFGPYTLEPGEERAGQCVSATLDNDEPLYINAVELTTGIGFHHSNWFWVPDTMFGGEDGTWPCRDRDYDEATAGVIGGVLFAQSTQAQHEIQAFDPGVAIVIPPHSRIVAGTHLLNPSDEAREVALSLKITPIAEPTTMLAGMAFQNQGIALPPARSSRFILECDLDTAHRNVLGRPVDFTYHYVLPHYHEHGTGMTLEAVREDGSSTVIYETAQRVGDALGGPIEFSMAGYSKLRFWCDFENETDQVIRWGNGDGEMCVFLAFTDSTYSFAGGVLRFDPPVTEVDQGTHVEFTHDCVVVPAPAMR